MTGYRLRMIVLAAAYAAIPAAQAVEIPSASAVIDQFERNGGVHEGQRRNHAKGVCASGHFDSSGALQAFSTATVFAPAMRTPVVARFSLPGSDPETADAATPLRGLGLSFSLADGEQWRTAMLNAPVFAAATPAAFFAGLQAAEPGQRSSRQAPDTDFTRWVKATAPSASYATERYNSLESYLLVDAAGRTRAVRWSFVPDNAPAKATTSLADELRQRLAMTPAVWRLEISFADAADVTTDSTKIFPAARQTVVAGRLTLDQASLDGGCRDIAFDPLLPPRGIAASNDPLLSFR